MLDGLRRKRDEDKNAKGKSERGSTAAVKSVFLPNIGGQQNRTSMSFGTPAIMSSTFMRRDPAYQTAGVD
jgi:hypothetical protein